MEDVLWYFFDTFIHKVFHGFHFPDTISIFIHESLLLEDLDVKELVLGCILFEALWDLIIAIADADHYKILLPHLYGRVHVHCVVVLEDSRDGHLQLCFIFVVHRDAYSQLRSSVFEHA